MATFLMLVGVVGALYGANNIANGVPVTDFWALGILVLGLSVALVGYSAKDDD